MSEGENKIIKIDLNRINFEKSSNIYLGLNSELFCEIVEIENNVILKYYLKPHINFERMEVSCLNITEQYEEFKILSNSKKLDLFYKHNFENLTECYCYLNLTEWFYQLLDFMNSMHDYYLNKSGLFRPIVKLTGFSETEKEVTYVVQSYINGKKEEFAYSIKKYENKQEFCSMLFLQMSEITYLNNFTPLYRKEQEIGKVLKASARITCSGKKTIEILDEHSKVVQQFSLNRKLTNDQWTFPAYKDFLRFYQQSYLFINRLDSDRILIEPKQTFDELLLQTMLEYYSNKQ